MMNSGHNAVILSAIIIGLVFHAFMYAGQPAIMAEMFPTRMRYSGVSLGYQVTSIVAGSLAPIIAAKLLSRVRLVRTDRVLPRGRRGVTVVAVVFARETKGISLETLDEADAKAVASEQDAALAGPSERPAPGVAPWSPAARAGSARRAPGTLAARGAHVTVADVDDEAAKALADEIGGTAWAVDLLDTEALERARARHRHPRQQRRHPEASRPSRISSPSSSGGC